MSVKECPMCRVSITNFSKNYGLIEVLNNFSGAHADKAGVFQCSDCDRLFDLFELQLCRSCNKEQPQGDAPTEVEEQDNHILTMMLKAAVCGICFLDNHEGHKREKLSETFKKLKIDELEERLRLNIVQPYKAVLELFTEEQKQMAAMKRDFRSALSGAIQIRSKKDYEEICEDIHLRIRAVQDSIDNVISSQRYCNKHIELQRKDFLEKYRGGVPKIIASDAPIDTGKVATCPVDQFKNLQVDYENWTASKPPIENSPDAGVED